MSGTMGMLRIDVEIESHTRPGDRCLLQRVIVDTGAELSWAPASVLESLGITRVKKIRFQQADGSVLERWVGFAILHAAGTNTTDEIVFGDPSDLVLLGARTLEGMNLKVDLVGKRLVAGGPMMAVVLQRQCGNYEVLSLQGTGERPTQDRRVRMSEGSLANVTAGGRRQLQLARTRSPGHAEDIGGAGKQHQSAAASLD